MMKIVRLSAPGMIRTCDTGFRRAVLYPLSYGGGTGVRFLRTVRPDQGFRMHSLPPN